MGVFFFKQKTAYQLRISYWSSGVCSSDLPSPAASGLLEYTFAAERVERAPLRGVRLVVALRHAGIADQIGFARHPASFTNGRIRRWKQDAPISAALGLSQSSFIKRAKGK